HRFDVRRWDVGAVKELALLTGANLKDEIATLAFSGDGATLAASGLAGDLAVWDVPSGKLRGTVANNPQLARTEQHRLLFAPDGKTLALLGPWGHQLQHGPAATFASVTLFDVAPKVARRHLLHGHVGAVSALVFSPDGRLLATGGEDAAVKLWDAATG